MEIEAKIKIETKETLIELIQKISGVFRYTRFETNVFYDTQQGKLKRKGEALRLRQEFYMGAGTEIVSMTFKGRRKQGKLKIRAEHEFNVTDFSQASSLLEALGYKEKFRFEKRPHSYTLGDCLVELDELPYLGHFVEVEGATEKKINKVLKQLGLTDEPLIKDGYGSLLLDDAKAHGRSKKVAAFENTNRLFS